jgi:endonuclease-3 related protein
MEHGPLTNNPEFTMHSSTGQKLMQMFDLMLNHFGPQKWWPAETVLEVMVGAVLTQNTNWKNVEKAIENLKENGLISVAKLNAAPSGELARLIRPAGYYNIKTKRLKNLMNFIAERYQEDLSLFMDDDTQTIRQGLLSVNGVGPETADSILLYAASRPVFVIDAYTYRILNRHGMVPDENATYDVLQDLFMDHLKEDPPLFSEFHALIVQTGKNYCKRRPLCEGCPLEKWGPTNAVKSQENSD